MVCSYADSFSHADLKNRWSEAKHERHCVQDEVGRSRLLYYSCHSDFHRDLYRPVYLSRNGLSREKMTKRSTKNRKTRARLLDTAGKLFRSQGFHATGLDQ